MNTKIYEIFAFDPLRLGLNTLDGQDLDAICGSHIFYKIHLHLSSLSIPSRWTHIIEVGMDGHFFKIPPSFCAWTPACIQPSSCCVKTECGWIHIFQSTLHWKYKVLTFSCLAIPKYNTCASCMKKIKISVWNLIFANLLQHCNSLANNTMNVALGSKWKPFN